MGGSDVTVEPPTISTTIEYDIIIATADTTVVSSVEEQLQDTAVMATALSAATGTTITPNEIESTVTQPPAPAPETNPTNPEPENHNAHGVPVILVVAAAAAAIAIICTGLVLKKRHNRPKPVSNVVPYACFLTYCFPTHQALEHH